MAISNNGDSEKVLATVVASVLVFTEQNADSIIYASGSNNARTRIYQMGISKYFEEIKLLFDIYGEKNQEWMLFEKNINYDAFLAVRKK